MLVISASLYAQNTVLTGKFSKLLPNKRYAGGVFISKPLDGSFDMVTESIFDRATQTFRYQPNAEDQNVIRYVGVLDEQYPFYLRKGEELTIDAGSGNITYIGKLSKENKVFADWFKLVAPLRIFGYTPKGYTIPSDKYVAVLDSLAQRVDIFIKKINTGNATFDKQVKYLLTYSYQNDVLMPLSNGLNVGKKSEYPAYLVNLFNNEHFADKQIWTLPFAFRYMQSFAFAKHIIYNSQQGLAGEMLVSEIADKELRATYILNQAEKSATQNLVKFLESNQSAMVTEKQKSKMAVLLPRARVQVTGGNWIDFSYPDLDGKLHRLSENLGKVVLIDVWATWCLPCLKEQPALEELEKSFEGKDVVFISLSIDTDKNKWKEMVNSKKLSGLHLFSNNQGPIVTEYELTGVPRFILFDKQGKTVSFDAPRPSEPKLKALIESKL